MNKSVIVYGLAGMEKYADRMAKHFNLLRWKFLPIRIVNGRAVARISVADTLYLAISDVKPTAEARHCYSFAEVAKQINDAIPRTPWFPMSQNPHHIGVYELRAPRNEEQTHWSLWDSEWKFSAATADRAAIQCVRGDGPYRTNTGWRGLAEEPIVVQA